MPLNFEPVSLEKQNAYMALYDQCPQKTSDYSFTNIWAWAPTYGLEWAWTDHLVWIKETVPNERYWAPVGSWPNISWQKTMGHRFDGQTPVTFIRVPEALLESWQSALPQAFTIKETRGSWDYLYSVKDLIELKGNRYHKKKNLLNQFKKKYPYRYQPFDASLVDAALSLQQDWCTWRDCESSDLLAAENQAIARVFKHWEMLNRLLGGALFVDDQIVAYTIGEQLDPTTLVIHFEKGDPDYKGVYQAINQMFLSQAVGDFRIVNREQDLDDPGLKKAKRSYHPIDYNQKYQVLLNNGFY